MIPPVSPSAHVAFQIMSTLEIHDRRQAIDFLRSAVGLPRLSIEDIRDLIAAFPILPPAGAMTYDRDEPDGAAQGPGRPWSGARYSSGPEPDEPGRMSGGGGI